MKSDCKRYLLLGAIICSLILSPSPLYAQDIELDYENYILVTVYPDAGITVGLQGSQSESFSPLMQSELKEIDVTIDVNVENADTAIVDAGLHLQLSPSYYSQLANLDMELTGHTDDTNTNLTILIDYPGYLGLDGSLGMVIIEPPYGFVLDLLLDAQLYYSSFPMEQLQMMMGMLPLFESQLASEVMAASDGNIRLEKLELLDYTEELDHASVTISLMLSGDLEIGLMSAYDSMGEGLPSVEAPQELPALTMESFDYHVTFEGSSLTLNVDSGGTIRGDLNRELNKLKDESIDEMLDSNELDSDAWAAFSSLSQLSLQLDQFMFESTSTMSGSVAESTFSITGLGLGSSSFEPLMALLEELSMQRPNDLKLVLVGETGGSQYVAFNVPSNVDEPTLLEEQRLVWEMNNIMNLKDVSYEVKTKPMETTTIVVGTVIGIAILGAAAYVVKSRV